MIVVDSSALIAIGQREPEARRFLDKIGAAQHSVISAVNYVETAMVLEGRYGVSGQALLDSELARLASMGLSVAGMDLALAELAREAFRRFGKGRHPARLNLGDCFAYALAKALDAPLLYKGEVFAATDIARA